MTSTRKLPARADHVGSLLRPESLTKAFRQHLAGEIGAAAFQAVQDEAIRDVVALQEAAGLKAITDGEFRRASYWGRFVERVDGLEVRQAVFTFHDDCGHETGFTAPHVSAKIRRGRPIAEDEFVFLAAATKETPKITLPSPPTMHFWRLDQGIEAAAYDSPEAMFDDLARVFRDEIAHLAGLGASYIQCDEVPLAMLCDPAIREQVTAAGLDPRQLIDNYIELFSQSLGDRPAGVTAAVHLCRGNFKGQFLSAGGYDQVAEKMFTGIPADAFFLEYDTPRAGDFRPLRFVPRDKMVVLGLVSSKTPELEPEDDLRRRIDEAAEHIDLDQLAISPQCGFASTVGGNPVTVDDQKAKLELIVRVADKVWG